MDPALTSAGTPEQWKNDLLFYLNGKRVNLKTVDPHMTLLEFLRSPRTPPSQRLQKNNAENFRLPKRHFLI
jgi:hypothetical protein